MGCAPRSEAIAAHSPSDFAADRPPRQLVFDSDFPIADEPLPRFLDDAAAAKLLAAARQDPDPFTRLAIEILSRTGMRRSEMLGLTIDAVVQIDVPRDLLTERAIFRRSDKRTGQIYHLKYNPPPPDAELEHRADDLPEAVTKRQDTYQAMTSALLPFYEKEGLLRRVDGVGTPDEVTERILKALVG